MKRIFLILLPLIAFTGHLLAEEFARITIETNPKNPRFYQIVIRNISPKPITYTGFPREGQGQPVYHIEIETNRKWIDQSLGWCGTGLGPCQLEAKMEVRNHFAGVFFKGKEELRFKVKISVLSGQKSEWNLTKTKAVYSPVYLWKDGKIEEVAAATK